MMTEFLNQNVLNIFPSGIRRYTTLAKNTPGCISLAIGEPDFSTPDVIKDETKLALDQNLTHYPPSAGEGYLLERISRFEKEKNGLDYAPDEILVTVGATEGIFTAIGGITNPGDEIIVPTPAFGLYEPIVTLFHGKYRPMDTTGDSFQITEENLARHLSPRTKGIVLNSPNNPTGVVYTRQSLQYVYRAVKERGIFVICDDVYAQLIYGDYTGFCQYQDLREKIIVVQSFSKPYAMTGWRVGYLLADRAITKELAKLHSYTVTSAVSFIQKGCLAALDFDPKVMIDTYRRRRDLGLARLSEMGLSVTRPEGAFYLFPSIAPFGLDGETFCTRMIKEAGVAAVPGKFFGVDDFIRLSYCCDDGELAEGLGRMAKFIKTL